MTCRAPTRRRASTPSPPPSTPPSTPSRDSSERQSPRNQGRRRRGPLSKGQRSPTSPSSVRSAGAPRTRFVKRGTQVIAQQGRCAGVGWHRYLAFLLFNLSSEGYSLRCMQTRGHTNANILTIIIFFFFFLVLGLLLANNGKQRTRVRSTNGSASK